MSDGRWASVKPNGERPPVDAMTPPADVFTECSRRVEERWWNEVKLPEVQP